MAATPERYQLSFTFGGLLIPETRAIAEAYTAAGDWLRVRSAVLDDNLLAKTRSRTSMRYFNEIKTRLGQAYPWEVDVIAGPSGTTGSPAALAALDADIPTVLFAIFTRYYRLVGDFMTDVVRTRIAAGLPTIDAAIFRTYMGDQSRAHPELTAVTDSTAAKLTAVTFRALGEAGIITGRGGSRGAYTVSPPSLSQGLRDRYCVHGTTRDFTHLLWTDEEIRPCLK